MHATLLSEIAGGYLLSVYMLRHIVYTLYTF